MQVEHVMLSADVRELTGHTQQSTHFTALRMRRVRLGEGDADEREDTALTALTAITGLYIKRFIWICFY